MPTSPTGAPLPAPAPTSLDELEELLYAESVRHYLAAQRSDVAELPFVRGTIVGREDGYATGLATAIHYITGEPVPDITDRVMTIAHDETQRAS
jgi:hypothetical protein